MFDEMFASIAQGFSDAFDGPFHDATIIWPGAATYDAGGDITAAADDVSATCKAQGSAADQNLRMEQGFQSGDIVIYILGASLTLPTGKEMDTTAKVTWALGPHAGTWHIKSVTKDTAGIGWRCRARSG